MSATSSATSSVVGQITINMEYGKESRRNGGNNARWWVVQSWPVVEDAVSGADARDLLIVHLKAEREVVTRGRITRPIFTCMDGCMRSKSNGCWGRVGKTTYRGSSGRGRPATLKFVIGSRCGCPSVRARRGER